MNNKDAILLSLLVGIKENLNLTELEKNVIIDGLNLLLSLIHISEPTRPY